MSETEIAKLALAYVAAYWNWHGGDYSKESMLRFRAARDALLAVAPKVPA